MIKPQKHKSLCQRSPEECSVELFLGSPILDLRLTLDCDGITFFLILFLLFFMVFCIAFLQFLGWFCCVVFGCCCFKNAGRALARAEKNRAAVDLFLFQNAALLGNFSETFRKRFGHFRNASETFRKRYGNFSETFRKLFVNFSETFRKLLACASCCIP